MSNQQSTVGRREFLGAAAAAGVTILKPRLVFGTQANSAVRLALLGCGGRGTNVTGSFIENTGAVVTALGDLFPDQLEKGKAALDALAAKAGQAGDRPEEPLPWPRRLQAALREQGRRRRLHRDAALLPPLAPRGRARRRQAHLRREAGGGGRARREEGDGDREAVRRQAQPRRRLPDPPRVAVRGAREADPRGPDRRVRLRPDPLLRLRPPEARLRRQVARRAAAAQLGPRQGALGRHHRRAERPHHRRHQLAVRRPPGRGHRLREPRRAHRQGRLLLATSTACSSTRTTCT